VKTCLGSPAIWQTLQKGGRGCWNLGVEKRLPWDAWLNLGFGGCWELNLGGLWKKVLGLRLLLVKDRGWN